MSAQESWVVAEVKKDWVRLVGIKYGYSMPKPNTTLVPGKGLDLK